MYTRPSSLRAAREQTISYSPKSVEEQVADLLVAVAVVAVWVIVGSGPTGGVVAPLSRRLAPKIRRNLHLRATRVALVSAHLTSGKCRGGQDMV